jgi:hypothetical protein
MVPAPWALTATARWRKFTYGEHFDPLVAIDIGAMGGISDDDVMTETGYMVGGDVGITFRPNRASALRLSGAARMDSGEIFVGATLEATYGLADGSVSRF